MPAEVDTYVQDPYFFQEEEKKILLFSVTKAHKSAEEGLN